MEFIQHNVPPPKYVIFITKGREEYIYIIYIYIYYIYIYIKREIESKSEREREKEKERREMDRRCEIYLKRKSIHI